MLIDRNISQEVDIDVGIAAQTMLLGATERGLGGCMLGAVKRDMLTKHLGLPPHLAIALVLTRTLTGASCAQARPAEFLCLPRAPSLP